MLRRYPLPPAIDKETARRAAREAIKGQYLYPFAIAGLASKFFTDGGVCTYQIILSPAQSEEAGLITEDDAKKIIKVNKMERVHGSEYGRIYEVPGNPFFEMWHGFFGTQVFAPVYRRLEVDMAFPASCVREEQYAYLNGEDEITICGSNEFIAFARKSRDIQEMKFRTIKYQVL